MRNRNVEAYRKAFPPKADVSRKVTADLRAATERDQRAITKHFEELEKDIQAAKEAADAAEERAKAAAQKRRLEQLRGKRL